MSNKKCVDYALFHLAIFGQHPEKQDTQYAKLVNVGWSFACIIFGILLTSRIFLEKINISQIADLISTFCLELVGMYNLAAVIIKRKKIIALLSELQEFWPLDKFGEKWRNEMEASFKRVLTVCYLTSAAFLGTAVYYIGRPIVLRKKVIPIPLYMGFSDDHFPGVFELFYVLESIFIIFVSNLFAGYDLLILAFIYHATNELRMIGKGLMDLQFQQETEDEIQKKLRSYVQHHNRVLRFIDGINDLYSFYFLCQEVLQVPVICMSFFVISANLSPLNADIVIKFTLQTLAAYLQYAIYCFGGTHLTQESEAIAEAIYNSEWTSVFYPKTRSEIVIIIQRTQKLVRLKAEKLFDVNLETFATLVKTSFSYFTLMKTVYADADSQ